LNEIEVKGILDKYMVKLIKELSDSTPWSISEYFRDNRTREEYLYDLLDGQIIEELVCLWFNSNGCKAERIGCDANGMVRRSMQNKITTEPDIVVNNNKLEIQISRNGLRRYYHIKKNKGDRILKGLNKLMFIVNDSYFIIGPDDINIHDKEMNYFYGGKETYVIKPDKYKINKFSDKNVLMYTK
jgi:hypothetical protein